MTWFAEMKRRRWKYIIGSDMITEYKQFLFKSWYDSLTDSERAKYEEYKLKQRKQEDLRIKKMERDLVMSFAVLHDAYSTPRKL